MVLRAALARTVMPVRLRNLVFHPTSLLLMFSIMNWKSELIGLLVKIGKPKYFPKDSEASILRMLENLIFVSLEQFLEKMILDLG